MMSPNINRQNGLGRSKSQNFKFTSFILALILVLLFTTIGAAQESNGAQGNIIIANPSDFPLLIPDDGSWLEVGTVDILAPQNGIVQSVSLKASINHPSPEQLKIQLLKDGFPSEYPLRLPASAMQNGGAIQQANIDAFTGAPAEGTWILRVRDLVPGGQGYLDSISVVPFYVSRESDIAISSSSPSMRMYLSLPEGAIVNAGNSPVTDDEKDESPSTRVPQRVSTWETITFEDFEGVFPSPGFSFINQSTGGEWYWDDTSCTPSGGEGWSAWPADRGADALNACVDEYANNMKTWMIYGPFDLSNAYEADTVFDMWHEIETNYDYVYFGKSHDGSQFYGRTWDGSQGWTEYDIYYDDYTGDSSVWVAWVFSSDVSATFDGPFVDNIHIWKNVLRPPALSSISNADGNGSYTVNWDSASGAESYELQEQKDSGSWGAIYSGSSTSRSLSGRSIGEWCYRARSLTTTGARSSWSSVKCTNVVPPAPSLYSINNSDSDGSYTVDWSAVSGTSYELDERKNSGSWSRIYSGSSSIRSLSGRDYGEWCYRVRARTSTSTSAWSNIKCTAVNPPAPNLYSISNSDDNGSYTIDWSSVSGTSYELQERKDSGSWSWVYSGSSSIRSLSGRTGGQWCYRVRALTSTVNSEWSNVKCVEVRQGFILLPAIFDNYITYFEGPREREDNDNAANANGPLRFGRTYRGRPDDKKDYFSLYLPSNGQFTIHLDNHTGQDPQLQLFYQSATVGTRVGYDLEPPYVISHNGQRGTYYIYVYSFGHYSSTPEYTLRVTRP